MSEKAGNLADGLGAIELHACFPGKALIQAKTQSGITAEVILEAVSEDEAVVTNIKQEKNQQEKNRDNWNILLPPPYLTAAPKPKRTSSDKHIPTCIFQQRKSRGRSENVVDGREETFWHCETPGEHLMLEGKGYCNWLMVDLEGTKEIKRNKFYI